MGILIWYTWRSYHDSAQTNSPCPRQFRFPIKPAVFTDPTPRRSPSSPLCSLSLTMSGQFVHLGDFEPRAGFLKAWERTKLKRVSWFAECFAEFVRDLLFLPLTAF